MKKGGWKQSAAAGKDKDEPGFLGAIGVNFSGRQNLLIALSLAILLGSIHSSFLEKLFENDRYFEALTDEEREMSFFSEQALYYSYYKDMLKTLNNAPSFYEGLSKGLRDLIHDTTTESPSEMNIIKRFNIYPEVLLAVLHHGYTRVCDVLGIKHAACYKVNQGDRGPPLHTCKGCGVPIYFYVRAAFILQGVLVAAVFLVSWLASGQSLLAGCFSVMLVFYNHREFTRAMWTPALRETFSFPFFLVQLVPLALILRADNPSPRSYTLLGVATFLFSIPWQFAQFALFTQASSLFAVYLLGLLEGHKLARIILVQLAVLGAVFLLQFGNLFLFCSFYTSFMIVALLCVFLEPMFRQLISMKWPRAIVTGLLCVVLTVASKQGLAMALQLKDDDHILQILRTKFDSGFRDFHAQLYVCSPEFDFMRGEFRTLSLTLLLPTGLVAAFLILHNYIRSEFSLKKGVLSREHEGENKSKDKHGVAAVPSSPFPALLAYMFVQGSWFFVMAVLIMRLKVFFTPFLVLLSSLVLNDAVTEPLFEDNKNKKRTKVILFVALIAVMSVPGIGNINEEISKQGQYENVPLDHLLQFVGQTAPNASFAASMPLTSVVRLRTGRPIVNHPHYEDVGIRARTYEIYKMYSRLPEVDVWRALAAYRTAYVVVDSMWCYPTRSHGCNNVDLYDADFPEHAKSQQFCELWLNGKQESEYFKPVYQRHSYVVLQVKYPS